VDVIVLLGTRWATLEHHTTRWRHVIEGWTSEPGIGSVVVVDFPRLRLGALVAGNGRLASPAPSWRPDVTVIDATVPAGPRRGPLDALAWWRVARAIRRALPSTPRPRLVACATPLWAPVLHRLGATWTLFDAVDDQRGLASHGARLDRVTEGYAALADHPPTAVTAVSDLLAERLRRTLGRDVTAVPNGVDLHRFRHPGAAPDGLPDGPFAVYAGVLEARVDIDLLEALADAVGPGRVVVCGPATPEVAARLTASAVTWLGPVEPALIPGLLGQATVGLLPHHVTDLTRSMDPLKLLEYLAAGLTVVATPVPVPADLAASAADWIVSAPDAGAFVRAVQAMLAGPPARHDGACVAHRRWPDVARRLLAAATHRASTRPSREEVAA
jgi:glycosyltransferase involved in cell wall biosynthesis